MGRTSSRARRRGGVASGRDSTVRRGRRGFAPRHSWHDTIPREAHRERPHSQDPRAEPAACPSGWCTTRLPPWSESSTRQFCPLNLGNVSTDRHRRLDGPRLFGVRRWARRVPRRSRYTRRGSGRRRRLGCDRGGRPGADQGLPDTPVGEVGPQRVAGTGVTGDESRMRRRSFVGQMIRPSQQHFSLVLVPFGVECSLRINVRLSMNLG